MAVVQTDAAVLAAEAGNFDRISGELQGVIKHVEAVGHGLQPTWKGTSGSAANAALLRFQEAAVQQVKELTDISHNIQSAGVQYTTADEDHASTLASKML